jgi:hypothetical protein
MPGALRVRRLEHAVDGGRRTGDLHEQRLERRLDRLQRGFQLLGQRFDQLQRGLQLLGQWLDQLQWFDQQLGVQRWGRELPCRRGYAG